MSAALPLTPPQRGMWAAQQLDPDSPALWTAEAMELRGVLDVDALLRAVRTTLAACDALHMRVEESPHGPCQRVNATREVHVQRLDFGDDAQAWVLAHGWMQRDLQQVPDLAGGPLFATALIRLGPDRHLWYLRAHHMALDGFGFVLVMQRVAQVYSALCAGRAPAPSRDWSLAPVVAEAQAYRASERFVHDREFWRAQLGDAPAPVTLAPGRPPAEQSRACRAQLPSARYAQWQAAARGCGVDWPAWLLAAVAAWLHRASGAGQLTLGVLVMNRLGSRALAVPCMAMNVVPLPIAVSPDRAFSDLAVQVAAQLRQIRAHQRYNYEDMRTDAGLLGTHHQLYGPVVNLMPFDRAFVFAGLASRVHPISAGSVEDLDITVAPMPDALRLDLEANANAYGAQAARALHVQLLDTIEAARAAPEAVLAALTPPSRPQRVAA